MNNINNIRRTPGMGKRSSPRSGQPPLSRDGQASRGQASSAEPPFPRVTPELRRHCLETATPRELLQD